MRRGSRDGVASSAIKVADGAARTPALAPRGGITKPTQRAGPLGHRLSSGTLGAPRPVLSVGAPSCDHTHHADSSVGGV